MDASLFVRFFNEIDLFLLILVRVLSFFIITPVLSATSIPTVVKLTLAVLVSYLIFTTGNVTAVYYDQNIAGFLILVVKEFMVGFITGFVVYLIMSVFYFAGQLIDYQIGFSMVNVMDPLSQIQVPVTGNLLYLLISIMLVETGGLSSIIAAFFYSYDVIPPGTALIASNQTLISYILDVLKDFFLIGVKIAMPLVGSIMILDIAMGILVKAVPQMNVFVVGMPIKLLVGMLIFVMIIPVFSWVYDYIYNETYRHVINIIRGMSP